MIKTDRQRKRDTFIQKYREADWYTDKDNDYTDRQTERQTGKQIFIEILTDRQQAHWQAERKADI